VLDEYDYTFQLGKAAELRTGRVKSVQGWLG
jgi:hypothetical protein